MVSNNQEVLDIGDGLLSGMVPNTQEVLEIGAGLQSEMETVAGRVSTDMHDDIETGCDVKQSSPGDNYEIDHNLRKSVNRGAKRKMSEDNRFCVKYRRISVIRQTPKYKHKGVIMQNANYKHKGVIRQTGNYIQRGFGK